MHLRVAIYDNQGKTMDRYTVTFHGKYRHLTDRQFIYLGCNSMPFHGIGMTGENGSPIDQPSYGHLGKKLKPEDRKALPEDVKRFIVQTAKHLLGDDYIIHEKEINQMLIHGKGNFPKLAAKRHTLH